MTGASAAVPARPTVGVCWPVPFPGTTPEQRKRVGEAARRLVELRGVWLNPPGLDLAELALHTLTNPFNARPTWLANARADLDAAVLAADGWPVDLADTPFSNASSRRTPREPGTGRYSWLPPSARGTV